MKKLLMIAAILAFATPAFAQTNTAGSTLVIPDTSGKDNVKLEIAASPKVNMSYVNPDTTTYQYFIIGTYHEGGTKLYATSSSITKIYYYTFPTNTVKSFAKLPASQADAQSEVNWTTTLGFND